MAAGFRRTLTELSGAQKGAARSAPAYSRFVNRKLGRVFAAWAIGLGLSPNAVTGISACFTFAGIIAIAVFPPSWWLGFAVMALLVIGYAFDSADGQVARYTRSGGPAGEWLDHVVDSVKVCALPLALLIGWYRFEVVPDAGLLVAVLGTLVGSVNFLAMILTEQLRRARGIQSVAATGGRAPWLRSVLVIPTDYGLLCLSFMLFGAPSVFFWVYTVITVITACYLLAALVKWFRELAAMA